jgi:hypothetical protein
VVESAYLLTALLMILRDLRRDCIPQPQGLRAYGFCTAARFDRCLSSGGDPGLEMEACGTTSEGVSGLACSEANLTIEPSSLVIYGLGSCVSNN